MKNVSKVVKIQSKIDSLKNNAIIKKSKKRRLMESFKRKIMKIEKDEFDKELRELMVA